MKTTILKILASIFLVAAISACDGDKDNDPNPENPENPENPNSNGGNGDNGTGTTADPFIVANKADLKRVASDETGPGGKWTEKSHYKQVADIDLSGEDWKPKWYVFEGSYDGGGFTISNLTTTGNCALFSTVSGTMKNVRLSNLTISNESASGTGMWAGGLVAVLSGGTLENCYIDKIEITWNYNGTDMCSVGGLIGYNVGTVNSCMVTNGTVSCNGNSFVGGLAGSNVGGTINNCYVTVNVSGIDTEWGVGGVAGRNQATIENCYATGNVSSDGEVAVGGIAGANTFGKIKNCVALNKTVSTTQTGSSNIGRIAGNGSSIFTSMSNNYARNNMTLTGTPKEPISDATTTSIHGANVTAAGYNGANSGSWWSDTADFPEEAWDFAPNRLPHLKGFGGLTQNPTVTP